MAVLPSSRPNQAGSGFTNLNRYLQANRQNRLGQTVASGVQQVGQQTRGALQQAGQQFQEKAGQEKARLGEQESKAGQILGNAPNAGEEDVKTFQNVLGAESKGPTGVANADELRSKAQEAESLGRAGGTEAGRFGLLQRYVGRGNPQYTAGQQRLDQMLLGQTGQQQLRQARAGTLGLGSETERQIGAASEQGKELQGQARQLAESTKGKLGQAVTDYDTAMGQQLADKTAQYQNLINQFSPTSNAPIELDEQTLNQLSGITSGYLGEGRNLYRTDISPYLKVNQMYATKQGAQSAEDLARAQALSKLGGNYLAGRPEAEVLQSYTGAADLAGKLAANPFEVTSLGDLSGAVGEQERLFNVSTDDLRRQRESIANTGSGAANPYGNLAAETLIGHSFRASPEGQQFAAQNPGQEGAFNAAAMEWAKNQRDNPAANYYSNLQTNLANMRNLENRIENELPQTYKTFRVLKKKPAVV